MSLDVQFLMSFIIQINSVMLCHDICKELVDREPSTYRTPAELLLVPACLQFYTTKAETNLIFTARIV